MTLTNVVKYPANEVAKSAPLNKLKNLRTVISFYQICSEQLYGVKYQQIRWISYGKSLRVPCLWSSVISINVRRNVLSLINVIGHALSLMSVNMCYLLANPWYCVISTNYPAHVKSLSASAVMTNLYLCPR